MQKVIFTLILIISSSQFSFGQEVVLYVFSRSPQLVNYNFQNAKSSFSQGISTGVGLTHKSLFLELGTFILEGDSYGHYSFFGGGLSHIELGNSVNLNTNVFGEVTNLPSQAEQPTSSWIFTSGVCFFPNAQFKRLNIGIPLCIGLAYQDKSMYLNSRFILNLSYSIK